MLIDAKNSNFINSKDISIHDYIFKEIKFDYSKKILLVVISTHNFSTENLEIEFSNVIGFNMISCDFWGKSLHILDWEIEEKSEKIFIKKVFDEAYYSDFSINNEDDFIESVISFASGDRLRIVCKTNRIPEINQGTVLEC